MTKNNNFKIILGVLALIVILVIVNLGDKGTTTQNQQTQGKDQFATINVDMKKLVDDDTVEGNANAPVTIVEFSDYECPYCARFYTGAYAEIITKYINTGKVKLVFRDFPLGFHEFAQKAAEAAECAGEQGKYYEMHNKLFENQAALSIENMKQWAKDIGLDTAKFNECFDSGKMAAETAKDTADGSAIGIQGTPGFIIGKSDGSSAQVISGAYPFSSFEQVIEAQLQ